MNWEEPVLRRQRVAALFLLAMTFVNAVTVFRLVPYLRNGYQDFTIFYAAGKMVRGGDAAHLYDLQTQYQVQLGFAPNVAIRHGALPYNHPPFEALIFAPFTYVAYLPAYLLWTFLNIVLLACALVLLRRAFPDVRNLSAPFIAIAATGFLPVVIAMMKGQDSILLLFLFTWALTLLEKERDIPAGAVLGAGLFKFHLALPLALVLAVKRPRLILGIVPIAALLGSISVMMVGWQGMIDYTSYVFRLEGSGAGGAISSVGMPNLRGLISELVGINAVKGVTLGVTVIASIVVMATALWVVRSRNSSLRFVFVVASVTSIMVSYHALTHDLACLLVVLLLLFSAPGSTTRPQVEVDSILLVIVYAIFLSASRWPWLNPWWFVPVLIWIVRKYPRCHGLEAAA